MAKKWKLLHGIAVIKSQWVNVHADRFQDEDGKELDYWHVERADTVIVLAVQNNQFLLPEPKYRVGVDEVTVDFAGGRIEPKQEPDAAAISVVKRELGINRSQIVALKPVVDHPLLVDSSFSNQKLYGFIAEIANGAVPLEGTRRHPLTRIEFLRQKLHCLQCRALLDEFLVQWQKDLLS